MRLILLVLFSVASLIVFLFFYNPKSLVNFVSTTHHFEKITDLAYGDMERQKLDIYIPNKIINKSNVRKIVIVFFHGGGWELGSKESFKFIATRLTKEGYIVILPNYRLYPEVVFPAFIEDAALAVSWLHNNLEKYAIDSDRVYLMGYSAGAQIASLLSTDEQYLIKVGVGANYIAGFIGLAGPYDFLPLKSNTRKKIFPEKIRKTSQPINYVDGNEVPFLLLHGNDDRTVLPKNSQSLAEKIRSKNGNVTLRLYDNIDHSKILAPFVPGLNDFAPTLQDIVSFINSNNKVDTANSVSIKNQ